jgi:hypothetical protein
VTDGGDGAACDHADWANARLVATAPVAPPAAVGAPTASAGSSSARVTWTAPAGPVSGYVVRYATTGDFVGATEVSVPADTNATTIGTLTVGVAHFVQVRAVNAAGAGPWAPMVPAPVVPYTVPAVPGDPVAGFTVDRVSLSWTAPHDGGAAVTGYEAQVSADAGTTWSGVAVEVQPTGGDAAGTGIAGTPVTAQVTAPLAFGVAQQFRVRAVNPAGPGPWSGPSAPVVPVGVPGTPVALTATPGSTQVALRWAPAPSNGAAVTAYQAEVATDPAGPWRLVPVASDLAALVDGLVDGTPHWFRIRAVNAAGAGPFATAGPVVPGSVVAPAETFVSDLAWVSARNGFGPVERDRANGKSGSGDGGPITVNGVGYGKGLGVHASSTVVFALRPGDARFVADVGVDDACGSAGTVVFRVLVDGVVRFQSARLTNQSATVPVSVDVAGGRQLTLQVTDGGDGAACDHADWADARLVATRG